MAIAEDMCSNRNYDLCVAPIVTNFRHIINETDLAQEKPVPVTKDDELVRNYQISLLFLTCSCRE